MRKIDRRIFIRKSAGAALGTVMLPHFGALKQHQQQEHQELPPVDWEKMLQVYDLRWTTVPADMTEAPHLGNGLIGSMIWIDENRIRLQVFRSDVHDHAGETFGWTAYSRPRYQIGYFLIAVQGKITDCDLRQDLYNAELKGTINTSGGTLKIEHFVHRLDDVIYTEIEATGSEEATKVEWYPFPAKGSRGGSAADKQYGGFYAPYTKIENPAPVTEQHQEITVCCQDLSAGGNFATAWTEQRTGNRLTNLRVTIQNSYPEKTSVEDAIRVLNQSRIKIDTGLTSWKAEHQSWWQDYYPESYVTFPDPAGQSFYWNNVYKLACCTRPDAQYIDTPGLWNSGGPWPYSTHDFNTQTAHFPVYTANRLHLGEALVESLYRNQQALIDNVVPAEWQGDSALLPLATAYDLRGKRDGDARYSDMIGCLPWLLNNCWLHYRYTMDQVLLKLKVYPLLRRSVNFYRHLLFTATDGQLHLPPSFSPETGNVSDCNFDLALLKWGCQRLIEICELLNIGDPLLPEWKSILTRLPDYAADERGYMLGSDKAAPLDHQHMSHLMMIYPLYLENIDTCKNTELLERSVRNFQPDTMPKMGASQSSPAAAALGLGNLALERMNDILYREVANEKLGKNGIYYLATPCIETSLSYNTCIQDMLLQSWGNKIRVFPAVPDQWKEVAFDKFRAEGAFLISAIRKNGITTLVKIKSLAGEPCIINPSMSEKPVLSGPGKIQWQEVEPGCYRIELKKGEEVTLLPG